MSVCKETYYLGKTSMSSAMDVLCSNEGIHRSYILNYFRELSLLCFSNFLDTGSYCKRTLHCYYHIRYDVIQLNMMRLLMHC